jgi:hypothetical protein
MPVAGEGNKRNPKTQQRGKFPSLAFIEEEAPLLFFPSPWLPVERCIRAAHKKRAPVHFISAFGDRMKSLSRTKAHEWSGGGHKIMQQQQRCIYKKRISAPGPGDGKKEPPSSR